MSELACQSGETACGESSRDVKRRNISGLMGFLGSGTSAGCCPIKTSCVGDGKCVVNSGDVVKRFAGVATFGVGMGLSAAAAVALC